MKCRLCNGTGKYICHKTWFIGDGFRREKCGICGGSGEHDLQPDPADTRMQAAKRRVIEEWGALFPQNDAQRERGLEILNDAWRGKRTSSNDRIIATIRGAPAMSSDEVDPRNPNAAT